MHWLRDKTEDYVQPGPESASEQDKAKGGLKPLEYRKSRINRGKNKRCRKMKQAEMKK